MDFLTENVSKPESSRDRLSVKELCLIKLRFKSIVSMNSSFFLKKESSADIVDFLDGIFDLNLSSSLKILMKRVTCGKLTSTLTSDIKLNYRRSTNQYFFEIDAGSINNRTIQFTEDGIELTVILTGVILEIVPLERWIIIVFTDRMCVDHISDGFPIGGA